MYDRDYQARTEIYHSGTHPGTLNMEYRPNRWPRFWRAEFVPDEPIPYARGDGDICRSIALSPNPVAVAQYGPTEAALGEIEATLGRAARSGNTGT